MVNVEKGTTAKWIQNAVYITMEGKEEEGYIGYGSLGDRDALYDILVECWKLAAPERYNAEKKDGVKRLMHGGEDGVITTDSVGGVETAGEGVQEVEQGKVTQCTGEDHYDELAIDTKIPASLDKVFSLIYHNEAFMMEFYEKDKKLTGEYSMTILFDSPLVQPKRVDELTIARRTDNIMAGRIAREEAEPDICHAYGESRHSPACSPRISFPPLPTVLSTPYIYPRDNSSSQSETILRFDEILTSNAPHPLIKLRLPNPLDTILLRNSPTHWRALLMII
jgi:hypothetical protein